MALTAITGAQVFDGEKALGVRTVVVDGGRIARVGGDVPAGSEVVDGSGATLLPGLIDAHVHSAPGSLALALRFGVTTELEMQGMNTRENRAAVTDDDTLADVRSSGFAITPPGGHPSELMPEGFRPKWDLPPVMPLMPFSTTPEEAAAYVPQLLARGSDFIKFMIDDGSVEGHPGLPVLDRATVAAGVAEAKKYGALTVAHALTLDATRTAAEAGVDGVTHVFMDQPHTDEVIALIKDAGMFVIPCLTLGASMTGRTGSELADDPRVAARLDSAWDRTLRSSYNRYPQGRLDDLYATVRALDAAGVDVLAGTDVSMPETFFGGLAHGASLHHELQYLVTAGLTPERALRAATATTARRFRLSDRGRIAEGLRADLLLVDGDPTTDIGDTLNTRAVWRRGTRLAA
ncbi:amidohydrolase family protein [Kitasatospora cineracea]|uniref:Imidazolonepropionase-like amidohydrolase n=1 Tax=Kitasatospora cineracea TaxID=88074 RepID=A0A3N4RYQ9_9ACTN|nr:amidohydrolase family protein [Kitasatospora cineracea]ROR45744.1 imidazolonepropionase-like amidohydrolase [Kitasatospora cineracea]RPE36099.1 imidazolonepropionase-like amidohydrolase [Kitasatospora cineracea]